MNLDLWLKIVNALAVLGSGALNVYLYLKAKSDERFKEYDQVLAEYEQRAERDAMKRQDFDRRLVKLETEFEAAPSHEDLQRIQSSLTELSSDVSTVKERSMNSLQSLRRIEQHLLERSK